MKRQHRLSLPQDFKSLFRRGKRIENPLLRVIVLANRLSYARLALVAPRAIEKRAVLRNRLRRRTSEWIRRNAVLGLSLDIAIFFKREAVGAPRRKLYEELRKIFDRNAIIFDRDLSENNFTRP